MTSSTEVTPPSTPVSAPTTITEGESASGRSRTGTVTSTASSAASGKASWDVTLDDSSSIASSGLRPGAPKRSSTTGKASRGMEETTPPLRQRNGHWGIGDDVRMGLE